MQIPAASTPPANGQSQAKLSVRNRMQKTPYWLKKFRRCTAPFRYVWNLVCGHPKVKEDKDPAPGDEDVEDLYETFSMAMMVSPPAFLRATNLFAVTTRRVYLLQIVVGFPMRRCDIRHLMEPRFGIRTSRRSTTRPAASRRTRSSTSRP